MFFVYLLKSDINGLSYVGSTSIDVVRRLEQHNIGSNIWTKKNGPFKLVYYESYKNVSDAKYREGNLKRFAQAYSQLKRRIKNSLE